MYLSPPLSLYIYVWFCLFNPQRTPHMKNSFNTVAQPYHIAGLQQ